MNISFKNGKIRGSVCFRPLSTMVPISFNSELRLLILAGNCSKYTNIPVELQRPTDTSNNTNMITNESQDQEKEEPWIAIPYVGNLSNKIAGILRRKLKWKITFTPGAKT